MWVVQLVGEESDLAALAQSFTGPDITISRDGQNYALVSEQFDENADARAVREQAEAFVAVLNGASRLALEAIESIRVGTVYRRREDGLRDAFVFAEPAVIRFRGFTPTVTLTHVDGSVEKFRPADPVKLWADVAAKNDAVRSVLLLIGAGALDWVNLYRILELVQSDAGGVNAIVANGWATSSSLKLFKHTANSPGALGLDARHGAEATLPPKHPMTISEARAMMNSIVQAWLRGKSS